jgi:hypothetical protein
LGCWHGSLTGAAAIVLAPLQIGALIAGATVRPALAMDTNRVSDLTTEQAMSNGGDRVTWVLDAALASFAVTGGALMAFGRLRDGAFSAFAVVGRRVTRDVVLPYWGDALVGLAVHAGQCVALGAAAAVLLGAGRAGSRVRTALVVVLAWELAARFAWLAFVRADVAAGLSFWPRALVAVLLGAALAIAPRRR